jgi:hypothetical protein
MAVQKQRGTGEEVTISLHSLFFNWVLLLGIDFLYRFYSFGDAMLII